MTNSSGALSGVRVVTCSTAQAGTVPYMLMADLGAEVIKIEVPNVGDNSRKSGDIKNGISSNLAAQKIHMLFRIKKLNAG